MKSTLFLIIFMLSGAAIAQYPYPYVHKPVHMKVKVGDTTLMQKTELDEYISDPALGIFKFDSLYIAHDDESFFVTSKYNSISMYAAPLKVGTFTDTLRFRIYYFNEYILGTLERWHYYPVSIEVEGTGAVASTDDKLLSLELFGNTISLTNPSEKFVSMEAVDFLGRRLVTSEKPILHLPYLPHGSYFILIRLKDEVVVKKILY